MLLKQSKVLYLLQWFFLACDRGMMKWTQDGVNWQSATTEVTSEMRRRADKELPHVQQAFYSHHFFTTKGIAESAEWPGTVLAKRKKRGLAHGRPRCTLLPHWMKMGTAQQALNKLVSFSHTARCGVLSCSVQNFKQKAC
jgi:hypothetical protein